MDETPDDLRRLQAVLTESIVHAGPFLRRSFQMPQHSLTAAQVARALQGSVTVALATVTARGEPRVAPIGALFYRGCLYIPTVAQAARARHVALRPAVSLTYFSGNGLAIIIHGQARILTPTDDAFVALEHLQRAETGASVRAWGEGIYLHIEAERIFTYAREPHDAPD